MDTFIAIMVVGIVLTIFGLLAVFLACVVIREILDLKSRIDEYKIMKNKDTI